MGNATTLLVDPSSDGHHLQSVSWLTRHASPGGPVVLLTRRGASEDPAYAEYLGDDVASGRLVVEEVFDGTNPSTAHLVREVVRRCAAERSAPVRTVAHLDGDQALKRWWLVAPRALRRLPVRPRVVFMLTRYPARVPLLDRTGWRLRVSKALLVVAGRLTGSLQRVVGYKGRGDTQRGWVVRRVNDPEFCSAHARDRDRWREEHGLPHDEALVGVFGLISERRNAPMVLEALEHEAFTRGGIDARLVVAGAFSPEVRAWVDGLEPARRARVEARDTYLDNDTLDQLVAAVDVIPVPLTNNGPSGIMGKAEAAGVAVVTAGSTVRAREVEALGGGVACDLTVPALADAMRAVLAGEVPLRTGTADQWDAVDRYCRTLLGESS
jgi:glycosyltransferase involved in cell wall biosynthesis